MGWPVVGSSWGLLQARGSAKPMWWRWAMTSSMAVAVPISMTRTGSRGSVGAGLGGLPEGGWL